MPKLCRWLGIRQQKFVPLWVLVGRRFGMPKCSTKHSISTIRSARQSILNSLLITMCQRLLAALDNDLTARCENLAFVDEIVAVLTTGGVGSSSSTSTYQLVKRMLHPAEVKTKQIACKTQGSVGQEPNEIFRSRGQLLIRGQRDSSTDFEATVESARDAINLFQGTVASIRWVDSFSEEPIDLGMDENENPIHSINFTVFRAQST